VPTMLFLVPTFGAIVVPTLYGYCAYKSAMIYKLRNEICNSLYICSNITYSMRNKKILIKSKRIKLDNGRTIIIDMPAKPSGEDPFKEAARLLSKVSNLEPID
jgi:hypothetical protein